MEHFSREAAPFRVVFVTKSSVRAKNLAKLAETVIPYNKRKIMLFAPLEEFKRDCLLAVCCMPHEQNTFSMFPGDKRH
jgi:hypothetical protein